jgi:hypothetical protein
MADFDLKSISPDTDGPASDSSIIFGADDQLTATPKPYTWGGVKAWIKSWLVDGAGHPGLKAGVYYSGFPYSARTTSGAPSLLTAYFGLIYIGGNSPVTISSLLAYIATAGTSNIQLALYSNDLSVSPCRPGDLIAATGNISVNGVTGTVEGTFTGTQIAPGWYWVGLQVADTTVRYTTPATTQFNEAFYIGSTTLSGFLSPIIHTGVNTTTGITSFGTWPSSLNGSTWNEATSLGPISGFKLASVP